MNTKYDLELQNIPVYSLHQSLLPFVGDLYEDYRLLHIGESHYINQTPDSEKYSIEYFKAWWIDSCQEAMDDSPGWVDTRQVMSNYMQEKYGAYSIFTNFIKSFSKTVLNKPIGSISGETKKLYEYVAFLNFFQMPSLYEKTKFWDSLEISAKGLGKPELALETWNAAVDNSIRTVDSVIDIINPKAVVFTSLSAGEAYRNGNGKYKTDSRVVYTSHPAYPYTWWKELKSLDGKRGIDVCEEGLARIYC